MLDNLKHLWYTLYISNTNHHTHTKGNEMKRITYKTLMRKIEDGYAEVNAWASETSYNGVGYANVTFYSNGGVGTRQEVEVTKIPADVTE